jgi:hypothetical protein
MIRVTLRSIPMLAAAALLAGCLGGSGPTEAETRQQLMGLSQGALLGCAGVPDRSRVEGGVEYMSYESSVMVADQAAGFGLSSGFGVGTGVGVGFGMETPIGDQAVRSNYCEANFTIVGGQVADVNFNTAGGYGRFDQCRSLVSACLHP